MKLNDAYPSPYLKGDDLPKPVTVTIERVDMEKMVSPGEKREVARPVVRFVSKRKGIILTEDDENRDTQKQSRVCKQFIETLGTDDTDIWKGRSVELYPYTLKAFGKAWNVIGVRPAPAKTGQPAAPATPPPPTTQPDSKDVQEFKDKVRELYPLADDDPETTLDLIRDAGRAALGRDYADWEGDLTELTPTQLTAVLTQLKIEKAGLSGEPPDGEPFYRM